MNRPLLIDTDVMIDYQRDHPAAAAYMSALVEPFSLPATVVGELYAGVRDGAERVKLDALVAAFPVVPTDRSISIAGGLFRRQYGKSHGVGFNDSMIAAAAEVKQFTLVTLNRKHFPMLTNVIVPYAKP